jgi:hypothetical protein
MSEIFLIGCISSYKKKRAQRDSAKKTSKFGLKTISIKKEEAIIALNWPDKRMMCMSKVIFLPLLMIFIPVSYKKRAYRYDSDSVSNALL